MSNKPPENRIPFERLSEGSVGAWALPSMPSTVKSGKPNIRNLTRSSALKEKIETVDASENPGKLTANELKTIAEDAHKEGYSEGYAEGLRKGTEQGKKKGEEQGKKNAYEETKTEVSDLKNKLKEIASSLFDPMESQAQNLEDIIVDMAVHYAEMLIEKELQKSPKLLYDIVSKAVLAIPVGSHNIIVSLNSKDADLLESINSSSNKKWSIQRDDSLKSGGCKVETKVSLVDYSIETRLNNFMEQLEPLTHELIDESEDVKSWRADDENNAPSVVEENDVDVIDESVNPVNESNLTIKKDLDKNYRPELESEEAQESTYSNLNQGDDSPENDRQEYIELEKKEENISKKSLQKEPNHADSKSIESYSESPDDGE